MEPEKLYRDFGEPIPGKLLFMDPQRLTLQSPLGILTLQRESALRYVFADEKQETKPADELRLIDGSIFKGKLSIGEGQVEIDHEILGKLNLPLQAVRAIARAGVIPAAVSGATQLQDGNDFLNGYVVEAGAKTTHPGRRPIRSFCPSRRRIPRHHEAENNHRRPNSRRKNGCPRPDHLTESKNRDGDGFHLRGFRWANNVSSQGDCVRSIRGDRTIAWRF
jgi:hypothetical protein